MDNSKPSPILQSADSSEPALRKTMFLGDGSLRAAGKPASRLVRPAAALARMKLADSIASSYYAGKESKGTKSVIPGYSGHTPGKHEIAGRSQPRVAARAFAKAAAGESLAFTDPLPASPHHKNSILEAQQAYAADVVGRDMSATAVGARQAVPRHVPGYTGYVPGIKGNSDDVLGRSFGRLSADALAGHAHEPKRDRISMMQAGERHRAEAHSPGFPFVSKDYKGAASLRARVEIPDDSMFLRYDTVA